jgi:DNA mismatch endonuclease (patch repair protein)
MQRQARRDTKPEVALRKALFARGLRYRVDHQPLPGMRQRADLVFTRAKVAVFMHGCFWHACPVHGTQPKANAKWWADKLAANVARDAETHRRLEEAGWVVVILWEHDDLDEAAEEVAQHVQRNCLPTGHG